MSADPWEDLLQQGRGGDPWEALLAPPPPAAPQQPQQPQGGGLWDSILEGGSDAVRGLNAGMYWGGSDEAEGALNSLAGRGDSLSSNVDAARLANAKSEQRSPWLYNAGKMLGYVPGMLAGPATAAGRVGLSALQGAASGMLSSDSDSLDEMASDTVNGGMWGLGGGMVGEGVSAGLGAIGRASENAGVGLRARNAGGTSSELNTIRQNQGIDQMQSGLTDDFRSLGLADSWKPQSAADVYRKLGPEPGQPGIMANAGQQTANAVDGATADGVRGSWGSVQQLMDNSARRELSRAPVPTQDMQTYAGQLQGLGEQLPTSQMSPGTYQTDDLLDPQFASAPPMDQATPRELLDQKRAYEASAYPKPGTVRAESDAPKAAAYRSAANAARGELGDVMEGTPQNSDYLQGQDTYSKAAPIASMAGARAARNEAGGSMTNPFTYGPAAAGAGLGGAIGGLPGAAAGAALGGVTNSLMRNYGQDVAGIGMQMAQRPLDVAAGMGQYAGQFSGPVGGSAQDNTRGFLLPQAARQLMQQDPKAFGPYQQQFFDTYKDPDSNALSNLITRLSNADPRFKMNILPKLQQLTAESY